MIPVLDFPFYLYHQYLAKRLTQQLYIQRQNITIMYLWYYNAFHIVVLDLWVVFGFRSPSVRHRFCPVPALKNTETNAHSVFVCVCVCAYEFIDLRDYVTWTFCMWRMEINNSPRGCHAKILLMRTRLLHSLPLAPKTSALCVGLDSFISKTN